MVPDSLYIDKARVLKATAERSTAFATSAGVAGRGMRLARERARPGVCTRADDVAFDSSSELGFIVVSIRVEIKSRIANREWRVVSRVVGRDLLIFRSFFRNLSSASSRDLQLLQRSIDILLDGRAAGFGATGIVGGDLGIGREARGVFSQIFVEGDFKL